jgi:hypothetical protein
MPKCTKDGIDFGRFGRRVIEADFSGGDLSSDGGLLLLRQVDRHLGLSRAAAAAIPDPRDPERIRHSLRDLLAQRLYGLCCGYEDLNDHKTLRDDVLMQTAVGRDEALASAPTFSRLENRATRAQAWALHGVLIDQFIASHDRAPEELVLDIDASDVPLHGEQELSQFHAYYDHHWCERADVGYVVGLARNARLHAAVELAEASLADAYAASRTKQRLIGEFDYAAKSWPHERRVITRLEYGDQGTNPRFIVTNLAGDPVQLYEHLYCQRGEAENRIKEAQLDLFGTRASCSRFIANQLRLLLAALAYTLMQRLRSLALQATELERASAATIRVRLLKIGAAILRNTRRVRVMLASHHPLRELFATAAARLALLSP